MKTVLHPRFRELEIFLSMVPDPALAESGSKKFHEQNLRWEILWVSESWDEGTVFSEKRLLPKHAYI